MKNKTDDFLLSLEKGLFFGAVVSLCLCALAFAIWGELVFFFVVYIIYGMGVGIATELTFSARTFRQKLLLYIVGILFSPPFALLFIEMSSFGFAHSSYFFLLTLVPLVSFLSCLCYMRAKVAEAFAYLFGHIAVFFALFISICFAICQSCRYDYNPDNEWISIVIFAILALSFSTISVTLIKKFSKTS